MQKNTIMICYAEDLVVMYNFLNILDSKYNEYYVAFFNYNL